MAKSKISLYYRNVTAGIIGEEHGKIGIVDIEISIKTDFDETERLSDKTRSKYDFFKTAGFVLAIITTILTAFGFLVNLIAEL